MKIVFEFLYRVLFFSLMLSMMTNYVWALDITLAKENSPDDPRQKYFIELLQLAFAKVKEPLTIRYSPLHMEQDRVFKMLKNGELTLQWTMTSAEREKILRAIPIPLLNGYLGARICLVRKGEEKSYDPTGKIIVQGHDWPDTVILRANGFRVSTATSYEALPKMVQTSHGDCFLRSIAEVQKELPSMEKMGLTLEPQYLFFYPTAMYFFVSPDNDKLYSLLKKGLTLSQQDGSLKKLLDKHYGEGLKSPLLNIKNRKMIRLSNPLLSPGFILSNPEQWYPL